MTSDPRSSFVTSSKALFDPDLAPASGFLHSLQAQSLIMTEDWESLPLTVRQEL